jgi:hypothetical protein
MAGPRGKTSREGRASRVYFRLDLPFFALFFPIFDDFFAFFIAAISETR